VAIHIIGTDLFGKTDRVPGLFYVATKFEYPNGFPILPKGTFVVLANTKRGTDFKGVRIRSSLKSMGLAYGRAVGIVLILGLAYVCFTEGIKRRELPWEWVGSAAGILLLIRLSYFSWIHRASPKRALDLGRLAGVPPEKVAERFVSPEEVPGFLATHQVPIAELEPGSPSARKHQ